MKRTPVNRPNGAELVRMLAAETTELPPTRREPDAPAPALLVSSGATEQINFRGSPDLSRLLSLLAIEHGSIRRVVAMLLRDAGHPVPDVDLMPPPGRRKLAQLG